MAQVQLQSPCIRVIDRPHLVNGLAYAASHHCYLGARAGSGLSALDTITSSRLPGPRAVVTDGSTLHRFRDELFESSKASHPYLSRLAICCEEFSCLPPASSFILYFISSSCCWCIAASCESTTLICHPAAHLTLGH